VPAWTAIGVKAAAHLAAVLLLRAPATGAFPNSGGGDLATTTALPHVVSPTGAFLAALYAEAAFAALSFRRRFTTPVPPPRARLERETRGWLARMRCVAFLADDAAHPDKPSILSTLVAGVMVAAGYEYPQYLAYREYRTGHVPIGARWRSDRPQNIFRSV
jgi:hypothetical protein